MPLDQNPIKDILYRTTARFITLRPTGLLVDQRTLASVKARILAHGPARTFYRGRKPSCRSLDGLKSLEGKSCDDCYDLNNCTSQLRLHLLIDDRPYCLLLAFTSAKNFLLYLGRASDQEANLRNVTTIISVADRGSWGEARFAMA